MKVKYTIAGHEYATKKQVAEHLHALKYRNATISEKAMGFVPRPIRLSDAEEAWLTDLLKTFKPQTFSEKCQGQFSHFELVQEPLHGGYHPSGYAYRGISIVRKDGSLTQISVTLSKLNDKTDWRATLISTLRHIVKFYINQERERLASQTNYCPILGMEITADTPLHVDHVNPLFHELTENWIKSKGITPGPHLFMPREDGDMIRRLKNQELEMDFINYHAIESTLMLVSAEANLKKGSKKPA